MTTTVGDDEPSRLLESESRATDSGGAPSVAAPSSTVAALQQQEQNAVGTSGTTQKPKGRLARLGIGLSSKAFKTRLKHRKLLIGLGLFGVVGICGVLAFLLILASLLKIPNFAQNMTEFEMTRLTRQFSLSVSRTVGEVVAFQTADIKGDTGKSISLRQLLEEKYVGEKPLLNKLQKITVNSIADNLHIADDIKFNYKQPSPGVYVLDTIEIGGEVFQAPVQKNKWIPRIIGLPFSNTVDNFKLAKQINLALIKAIGEGDTATASELLARAAPISLIIQRELGINYNVWNGAALLAIAESKSNKEASRIVNADAAEATSGVGNETPPVEVNSQMQDAEEAAIEADKQAIEGNTPADNAQLDDAIANNNGIVDAAAVAANNAESSTIWQTGIKDLNPSYEVALMACMLYEGSLDQSSSTIDSLGDNQVRAATTFLNTASTLEAGADGNADKGGVSLSTLDGVFSNKLGDVNKSDLYQQLSGVNVNTLAGSFSTETSATGDFTLLNAAFNTAPQGSQIVDLINKLAVPTCQVFTNPIFAAGIAISNILGIIATFGGEGLAVGTADAAEQATLKEIVSQTVSRIVSATAQKILATGLKDSMLNVVKFIGKQALVAGLAAGSTIVLKLIVMQRAGALYSGLEQNQAYANMITAGTNRLANEQARQIAGGRALTCNELQQTSQADKTYLADANSQRSITDRYLAISNPDSLLSRAAVMTYSQFGSILSGPMADIFNFFTGPLSLGTLFGDLTGIGYADTPCSQAYYGNVQFGWSEDEEKLIDSNDSYLPLQNQKILDQSGQEDQIAQKYAPCFGYKYNASGQGFDPADSNSKLQSDLLGDGSMGALLSSGNILRTSDGDLVTNQDYLCSPQNLGPSNEMAFRFRLALSYDNSADMLTNLQTVSN